MCYVHINGQMNELGRSSTGTLWTCLKTSVLLLIKNNTQNFAPLCATFGGQRKCLSSETIHKFTTVVSVAMSVLTVTCFSCRLNRDLPRSTL